MQPAEGFPCSQVAAFGELDCPLPLHRKAPGPDTCPGLSLRPHALSKLSKGTRWAGRCSRRGRIVSCVVACSWNTTEAMKGGSCTSTPHAPMIRRRKDRIVSADRTAASTRPRARRQSASTRGTTSSETSAGLPPARTARCEGRAMPQSRAPISTKRPALRM